MISWEGWENNEVVWSERWECNEVAIGKDERVARREGGMEFKDKIVLYSLQESEIYAGIHCRDLIIVI